MSASNHRIGACLELEAALTARFQPDALPRGARPWRRASTRSGPLPLPLQPSWSAFLRMPTPLVIALGTGRALRGNGRCDGRIAEPISTASSR